MRVGALPDRVGGAEGVCGVGLSGGPVEGARPPRVFISYAHESDAHAEAVRDLWIFLRLHGVDAQLDRVAAQRRQDWALWMERQVREADHVLVIASAAYRERAEDESGPEVGRGVQWEARLIRNAFYADQRALDRFVPVVLPGQSTAGVPDFLAPATSTVYTVSEFSVVGAEPLLRLLLGRPEETEPPLGAAPVLGSRPHTLSSAATSSGSAVSASSGPLPAPVALRHEVGVHVTPAESGGVRVRTELAGTLLGEQVAGLPPGLGGCWAELDSPTGAERLDVVGARVVAGVVRRADRAPAAGADHREPVRHGRGRGGVPAGAS